jgi:hypothetical protein
MDQPTFSWTAASTGTPVGSFKLWIVDQTTRVVTTISGLPANTTSYTLSAGQALTPGHNFDWYVAAVSTNGRAVVRSKGVNFSIAPLG